MERIKAKRETLIRKETRTDSGYKYEYMLYVKESPRVASFGLPLYSIGIKLSHKDGDVTDCEAHDIFSDNAKATSFFERLVNNLATPLNLPYILEDELSK